MSNNEIKKMQKDERLTYALLELQQGQSLEVPYRLYSVPTIRSTASALKLGGHGEFAVNARGNVAALVTRTK